MYKKVSTDLSFVEREKQVVDFWKENDIFKKSTGMSIMKYYNMLKIQEAKKLLRKNIPIAAIAGQLNFESATYFTKVFKKYTQMTPTAYKRTIL